MSTARTVLALALIALALLIAAVAVPLLTGCRSESATATATAATAPATAAAETKRVSQPAIKPANEAAAGPPTGRPARSARPVLRPGAKTVVLERAGDRPFDKTFDDLRFEIALDQPFHRRMLTEAIENLAGTKIRIRGYVLPTAQKRGIKQFVLVRDNQECCFGPGAALFDCILVEMKEGKTAEFSIRPVAVAGTFDIREIVVDGRHLAIYHLDADAVE